MSRQNRSFVIGRDRYDYHFGYMVLTNQRIIYLYKIGEKITPDASIPLEHIIDLKAVEGNRRKAFPSINVRVEDKGQIDDIVFASPSLLDLSTLQRVEAIDPMIIKNSLSILIQNRLREIAEGQNDQQV